MKKGLQFWIVLCILFTAGIQIKSSAQTIVVNPDGTHSVILNAESAIATQVNPDGTHTTIFNHGNMKTIVNPDGSHSIMHHANTSMPMIVHPDGSHSVIFHANTNMPVIVNSNGSQSAVFHANANSPILENPVETQTQSARLVEPEMNNAPVRPARTETVQKIPPKPKIKKEKKKSISQYPDN